MNDNEIIIKPANKGSAVAIWSKHDYLLEASNQLSDTNVYCKSNSNTLQKVNSDIKSVLRDMFNLQEVDQKIMNYLTVKKPQLSRFYLLPKIYKRTMNVPGRPITSSNGTATERISSFSDFHLKNIIPTIPHILENIRDFLYRIAQLQNISEGTLLVSFDVVGLSANLRHSNWYEICTTICQYFMAGLEEEIFKNPRFKLFLWLRYLDNIFCLWTKGGQIERVLQLP